VHFVARQRHSAQSTAVTAQCYEADERAHAIAPVAVERLEPRKESVALIKPLAVRPTCRGTRRVRLVRGEGRGVST